MEIFAFPTEDNYQSFESKQDLRRAIQVENRTSGLQVSYNYYEIKDKYLYAKCRYYKCKAQLSFKRPANSVQFELFRFEPQHNHSNQKLKCRLNRQIEDFIKEFPITLSIEAAKSLIRHQFSISESKFYYHFRKARNQKTSFRELADFLDEKHYEVQTDPFYEKMNELPTLMIVITPKMKQNFQKFGDWVGFDYTFNLIQEKHESGRNWRVGCFMGISNAKRLVPFGLVISTEETKDRFYQIFKSFSNIMNKSPKVIISDEDKALIAALKDLKDDHEFQGEHLLDSYHILKNVKKNLKNKEHFKYFRELIAAETEQRFELKLNECIQKIQGEQDMQLLSRFVSNSQQYCFSKIPSVLFGFFPNTSMNEKVHDLIKRIIPYSKPFTVVVTTILSYLEILGEKCEQYTLSALRGEDLFNFPLLKEVRFLVAKPIFQKILNQISKSIYYQIVEVQERSYEIKDETSTFVLSINASEKWNCKCSYSTKTGIPCSHLLRILMINNKRILPYIHPRWLLNLQKKKKYQFQRKARRNMIK